MTNGFPPLLKPDGRFSRIRLSEFLSSWPKAAMPAWGYNSRTFMALIAQRAVTSSSLRFLTAEQVASLGSSMFCPNQRSGMGSSLQRTPPTPVVARTAFSFDGVAPPVESSLLAMTGFPAYPSVTSQHVAHRGGGGESRGTVDGRARPRRSVVETRDGWSGIQLCGLRPILRGSAAGSEFSRLIFEVHLNYDLPVRFRACSPPRLAATQLARSAVLNRLIAPTGLSPALTPASRTHQDSLADAYLLHTLSPLRTKHLYQRNMWNVAIILALLIAPYLGLAPFGVPEVIRGRIGITCVFLFTGLGHFLRAKEMSAMVPLRIPEHFRLPIIYASGIFEWAAAVTILVPAWTRPTGFALSAFLLLILPANIDSAIRRVPFGGHGAGPIYLFVRVPLQLVLIVWVYWFSSLHPATR